MMDNILDRFGYDGTNGEVVMLRALLQDVVHMAYVCADEADKLGANGCRIALDARLREKLDYMDIALNAKQSKSTTQ